MSEKVIGTAKNGVKVVEKKVEKPKVEVVKAPEKKAPYVRWVNGHKLEISNDIWCNIKCLQCGLVGRTYLTPFNAGYCQKPQADEYGYVC